MLLNVENMSCQHCVRTVTNALHALDPDAVVEVDLNKGEVKARGKFSVDAAIAALVEADYPARLLEADA